MTDSREGRAACAASDGWKVSGGIWLLTTALARADAGNVAPDEACEEAIWDSSGDEGGHDGLIVMTVANLKLAIDRGCDRHCQAQRG
jgi:hypothetical protein